MAEIEAVEGGEQPESRDFARVRTRAEEAEARAKALEAKLLARTIKEAGFDPAAPIVQMIADKFDGDIEDSAAFAAHATALGFTTSQEQKPQGQDETAKQVDLLQSRGDALRDLGTPAEPPTRDEQIRTLEASGTAADLAKARALKAEQLRDLARRSPV